MRDWFAFFSHTGTEIVNICEALQILPRKVVTNKTPGDKSINKRLLELPVEIVWMNNRPGVQDYNRVLSKCYDCVCTLHGWMRIIPEEICTDYEMYNLHPGLISKYPELKGADPQSRISEDHTDIGLVIHHVSPELDGGSVVMEKSTKKISNDIDDNTHILHEMATTTWIEFFQRYIT